MRVLTQEIKGCSLWILLNLSEVSHAPVKPNEALLRISQDMARVLERLTKNNLRNDLHIIIFLFLFFINYILYII